MNYHVRLAPLAERQLRKLPVEAFDRMKLPLVALGANPRPPGCLKMKGGAAWRIRVGNYRIVYDIDDQHHQILILPIAHRREVYR